MGKVSSKTVFLAGHEVSGNDGGVLPARVAVEAGKKERAEVGKGRGEGRDGKEKKGIFLAK